MQLKILDETESAILGTERYWLTRLQVAMAQFPATEEDREALEQSVRQLDELFLLVVVGEFNSGKSAVINALFGEPLLEMGVTPTTTRIHLLKHGKTVERVVGDADVDVFTVPSPFLEEITIVDTPGTNAIYREHEVMTQEFLPRSDLVLFITSVDRPFTESERAFLALIREWGKKVVVVLNKIDILETDGDLARIEQFIEENAQKLLGFMPEVIPVSARDALHGKQIGDPMLIAGSRIDELESYIGSRLDEKARVHLKLLNPLGVGLHLTRKYLQVTDKRMTLLQDDFAVIDNITQQLVSYQEELAHEFRLRLSDVEREFEALENRGIAFFDDTMRLVRLFDLLDKDRLERDFRERVVADTPAITEERVSAITEWLVARQQNLWQMVVEHVRQRKTAHADRLLGEIPSTFEIDRKSLIESVSMMAQNALQSYDRTAEARRVAVSLQRAVANTALVEVGAVGMGTLIAVIASSTVLDITGIVAAGTMAVLGLLVIPNRRRRLKDELREKIAGVRSTLVTTLTAQFEAELAKGLQQIREAIAPYTRFVGSQQQHWGEVRKELVTVEKWLKRQEAEIKAL